VDIARAYCELVDGGRRQTPWLFAHDGLSLVVQLYQAALLLPAAAPERTETHARPDEREWKRVLDHVGHTLTKDYYWLVLNPLKMPPEEPVCGQLSEDLADIWRDLKEGLLVWETGTADSRSEAWSAWRNSFEIHWSQHAACVIGALNALCFANSAHPSRMQESE
jgi:hypothetical protein